jgi:5-methyltetrahydropteroyltriglutamate--homocysteine methyltransferase
MNHGLRRARTDHVGSLLRPEDLKAAFLRRARGQLPHEALLAAQDEAIRGLVAEQEAHGLVVLTDGEYRRLNWQVSFSEVEGWDLWPATWKAFVAFPENRAPGEEAGKRGLDTVVSSRTPATGRMRLARSFPAEELRFLRALTARPVKITLMGPDRVRQMCDVEASAPHYRDAEDFLADVVRIQREMVDELAANGCDYVQIDEPSYTGYVDETTLGRMRARGEDPMASLRRAVEADNAVIDGAKGKIVTGLHVCRGNRASMWHREGTYDAIAETLFGGLDYDRLLLEYDTERAGSFAPLRFVRKGAIAVIGLVTTKSGRVETVEELAARIDQAAKHLPLDQLALSPQCGFASGIAGNQLTEDEQWRKLDAIAETARRVWGVP